MAQHIVAIGGGGFSDSPEGIPLEQYIVDLTGKKRPKVCFLPQASAESADYINRFYNAFVKLDTVPSWQSFFGRVEPTWCDHLLAQDVIYAGGGNTRSMLVLWREWGVDRVLKEALENGVILAGVSAGAICWFEQGVTDSVWPLGALDCLGFLKGSACPHYDGEPERRPAYLSMVGGGDIMPGIAIQDDAAAHYVDGELKQIIVSRREARAFDISVQDGDAVETELPAHYIGA